MAATSDLSGGVAWRGRPRRTFGPREERIASSRVWVLPNPSGLNASYQLPALTRMFRKVRIAADKDR